MFFVDISGVNSVPRIGPLSKFFRQLRGRRKENFLSFCFLKNNQPKLDTSWGGTFYSPTHVFYVRPDYRWWILDMNKM